MRKQYKNFNYLVYLNTLKTLQIHSNKELSK